MNLLVKNPKTGETRPMTQKSFDLAGKKRGFQITGTIKDESSSNMDDLKAQLRAQKAAGTLDQAEPNEETQDEVKPKGKPGPKPKTQKNED